MCNRYLILRSLRSSELSKRGRRILHSCKSQTGTSLGTSSWQQSSPPSKRHGLSNRFLRYSASTSWSQPGHQLVVMLGQASRRRAPGGRCRARTVRTMTRRRCRHLLQQLPPARLVSCEHSFGMLAPSAEKTTLCSRKQPVTEPSKTMGRPGRRVFSSVGSRTGQVSSVRGPREPPGAARSKLR